MLEEIKKIFGLDSKLTDEEVNTWLKEFNDKLVKENADLKGAFKDLKLKEDAGVADLLVKFKEIQTENETLKSSATDMEKNMTGLTAQMVILVAKDKTRDAEKLVDTAIGDGKILPKDKGHYIKFAEKDAELFENTLKIMPKLTKFEQQFNPDNKDTGDGSATFEFTTKVKAAIKEDPKLTEEKAQALVLKENPGLDVRILEEDRQKGK